MSQFGTFKIRPAARHLVTIGEELIQDQYAAILELVKNGYDADSPDVIISFRSNDQKDFIEICIEDHGHGMSSDDVINKWLVPSTDYKFKAKRSPKGRVMQGRKGIGRYAANILGDDLFLDTVNIDGEKTNLYVVWDDFQKYDYLDQVDLLVESYKVNESSGTKLTIKGDKAKKDEWNENALKKLRFELKKLIPPKLGEEHSDFMIILRFEKFFHDQTEIIEEEIHPYPILELFDYKISGEISSTGKGILTYTNQKIRNGIEESFNFDCGETGCGKINFDIRVYDRDKDSIDQLIIRGLRDENTGNYVSKLEARRILNDVNGIGVYRNGFRIRPLGDADFDWLRLNEQRIQNPSLRIGNNQVVGYVHIESEELSNLEEKSARDGLKDNDAFKRLKSITRSIISELETRRYSFRRKMGITNSSKKIEKKFEELYDYSSLKNIISSSLKKAGLHDIVIDEVNSIISKDQEKKNEVIEEIKRAVAVYQGQATLGKIINIILHEGRRPLNYFRNQIPNLNFVINEFKEKNDGDSLDKINHLTTRISENANVFVRLFSRLDPLSAKRGENRKEFVILDTITAAVSVFENELKIKNIDILINCPKEVKFYGWKQDFHTIFVNLIDNSIFWIHEKECIERTISIELIQIDENWEINYYDSGPGIELHLLASEIIFDPEFTTKTDGSGLGLSIAGEAASRNGLSLKAIQHDKGAHFRISTEKEI